MIKEYLREFHYTALQSNMSLSCGVYYDNLQLDWNGYNDTLNTLVEETLVRIKKF